MEKLLLTRTKKTPSLPSLGLVPLLKSEGAKMIPTPTELVQNLYCVVDRGEVEECRYVSDGIELYNLRYNDTHFRTWLIIPDVTQYVKPFTVRTI